ncbi:Histidine kinase A [Tieghemostelium lacteum]|uniref:Histidine kinase A n=1 Tax=Tieghemostelium lacteum TaxID=361077 RepID=A0A152A2T4_TIELA|nr:Histidine kinase A [Tieghemostelium lacteum]|eukprot:KYR00520.1 Histidine kinase A [Tieghemostelium lacteum]
MTSPTHNGNSNGVASNVDIEISDSINSPPKFNLTSVKNLDIHQLGSKINNFSVINNNVINNHSSSDINNVHHSSSSNNIDLSANSITSSNYSNDSSNNASPTLSDKDKKSRRFSMYVYQHPTDEQKRMITELYGYKEHHEHSGYKYTHDSNTEIEDTSSSDSYSVDESRSRSSSGTFIDSTSPYSKSDKQPPPPPHNNNNNNNKKVTLPTTILPDSKNNNINYNNTTTLNTTTTTTTTTQSPTDLSQIPQSYVETVVQQQNPNVNYGLRTSNYKVPTTTTVQKKDGQYLDDEYDESKSINQPTNPTLSSAKDWNTEFQNLVNSDKIEGYRDLSKLAHDFVYTAKIYGKVIISELTLPLHLKTIKPINIGGIAGGYKYICLGILFKLALDSQGLYVGDQNAMKAAGHELKGLMSYYNCQIDGLHHPLMALIDYRGYRLVAMSLLPITNDTIVYGSSDGGTTVHSDSEIFNQRMKEAARILNLKGHMVGRDQQKLLYSCGDIEGHVGLDGKAYLLDFARVFPPQMKIIENAPPSHLYELIRPELVKSNPKPLSSDALTGWGKFDQMAPEHNYEVKEASFRLLLKVIPDFAKTIDIMDNSEKRELHLTQELHRVGINCRHLGMIRRNVTCKSMRKTLLSEIMARTMKCEIMSNFRSKMKTADTPSEEPFKEVVVSYMNKIFKFDDKDGKKTWPKSLKKSIEKKFLGTFQVKGKNYVTLQYDQFNSKLEEDSMKRYIRGNHIYDVEQEFFVDCVDVQYVMKRFSQLTGVGLTSRALRELMKHDGIRLVQSDVKRMKAKVKAHHLVEFAEGMVLWDEAKLEKSRENIEGPFCPMTSFNNGGTTDRITDRLMGLADDHFRSALSVSPHSGEVSSQWAMMLVERARMARESVPLDADAYYNAAEEKLRNSVFDGGKPKISLENVLLEYSEFLCVWGTKDELELDMNDANGLKSQLFQRASKKLIECIKMNPSKFAMVLSNTKVIEKEFHSSEGFKQMAAYYAGVTTICNCLIQTFESLPKSCHAEIANSIVSNKTPYILLQEELKKNPEIELLRSFQPPTFESFQMVSDACKRMGDQEAQRLAKVDPFAIIRVEMGCLYLRYGYISHVFGIQCSKRSHTKMASIKLLKKSGSLLQKGIDLDPINRDMIVDHIKKFTSSSQFVDFYQSAIGCPSILDFLEDRLLRLAHMSLKDCFHLPIEFIEGLIEYSPRVKMLVLDGCSQITDSTIDLIVRKLPYLETLSLVGCKSITTIISSSILKEFTQREQQTMLKSSGCGDRSFKDGMPLSPNMGSISGSFEFGGQKREHSSSSLLSEGKQCFLEKSKEIVNSLKSSKHHSGSFSPVNPSEAPSSPLNGLVSSLSNIISSTSIVPPGQETSLRPLTFLQTLNLNDCEAITDEKLILIAQMQLPLVNLYLKKCNITDNAILQLTREHTKFAVLELSQTNITDLALNNIAMNCPHLKEIQLDKCSHITFSSVDKLVRQVKNLRLISLADCPLAANDNTLRLIGKYSQELQCLNLTRNAMITDQGMVSMCKHTPQLNELDITQCTNLTDQTIMQMSLSCTKLRILKMVGLNYVFSLKPIGTHLTELVHLDISECHKISSDLGSITKGCTKLNVFRLRRCYGFQDVSLLSEDGEIHQMQRLSFLDCSHGNIEFKAIHSITHSCKSLTNLNISYCKALTDNAIERIANTLQNLKKLKLDGITNITDDGIKSLSEGNVYQQLEVLSLVSCRKISDVSAHHILRFAALKKISVGGCLMTTQGVDLIASNSFELVKICIRPCLNINSTILIEKYPHINLIQLRDIYSE